MDLRSFSGDSFDLKDWVNQTFKSGEAQKLGKEQYASQLVMKLQLLISKLNSSIEDQAESVASSMPRVLREAESLQHEAGLLQVKMSSVQEEIDKVNRDTGASMEVLMQMDILKERIQATRRALKEADNWTTLTNEIEDAFDNGDFKQIAEKLTGIQSSLKILTHVPDYDERVIHVEELKNRLEALSSPQLVIAFNSGDAEKAKLFVGIFRQMERYDQLLKYYRKCLKAKILKIWAGIVEEKQEQTILEWSTILFESLEALLLEQVTWFESVFDNINCSDHLIQVLLEVWHGMDPKMDFCLEAALKQQERPLEYLIKLKSAFNQHSKSWADIIPKREKSGNLRELAKSFYQPFREHVAKYAQYESSLLLSDMINSSQTSKDLIDELRNVSNSVQRLIKSFGEGSKRCCDLTEGCGYPALVEALEDCLKSHLEKFRNLMRRLDKRKEGQNSWSILQHSLTLNQTCGDLILHLEQLDLTMSMEFLEKTKLFLGDNEKEKVLEQHHLFLLDLLEIDQLKEFHRKVKQGTNYPLMSGCLKLVTKVCQELQKSTFNIIFFQIQEELSPVAGLESWGANMGSKAEILPDFSFSPQEYITQIGQYLMTMPQHLEPYMTNENPALSRALRERVFPYCSGILESVDENPADFLLACVARATCDNYQASILKIPNLTANATKQLIMDIGYLGDILEDLGHPLTDELNAVLKLLKLPANEYWVQSTGCPQKLVSTIRQIRKLDVSG